MTDILTLKTPSGFKPNIEGSRPTIVREYEIVIFTQRKMGIFDAIEWQYIHDKTPIYATPEGYRVAGSEGPFIHPDNAPNIDDGIIYELLYQVRWYMFGWRHTILKDPQHEYVAAWREITEQEKESI